MREEDVDRERVSLASRAVVKARVHFLLRLCALHPRSDDVADCVVSCDRRNRSNVGDGAFKPWAKVIA